jgi:hypothetical protein
MMIPGQITRARLGWTMVHMFCAAKKAKLSGMFNGNLTELRLRLGLTRFRRISVVHDACGRTAGITPSLSPGIKKPAPIVYRSRCKSITQISKNFEKSSDDWLNHCRTGLTGSTGIIRMIE